MQQQYPFQPIGATGTTPTAQTTLVLTAAVQQVTIPAVPQGGCTMRIITDGGTGTYVLRGGVTSTTAHIGIAGGASVELYGFEWRHAVLTTPLAATLTQYCTSTESTPAAETGNAVLTAAGWVSLGTGAAGVNTVIA
jgi:hypothetical protein